MTTNRDLEKLRRNILLKNPGWPYPCVCGFVDGMLDGLDGNGPQLQSLQKTDMQQKGYRIGYRFHCKAAEQAVAD